MARAGRRGGSQSVVGGAECADARLSRQAVGSGGGGENIDGVVRKNFTELFIARLAPRGFVRDEIPAAETATDAGDARLGRRSEIGEGAARSERDGCQGP